jgi:hypothetical protein
MSGTLKKVLGPAAVAVAGEHTQLKVPCTFFKPPVPAVTDFRKGLPSSRSRHDALCHNHTQVSDGVAQLLPLPLLCCCCVCCSGLQHLVTTGLEPIKGVRVTYPKAADVPVQGHTPEQVSYMHGDLLALAAGQARQMGVSVPAAQPAWNLWLPLCEVTCFTYMHHTGVKRQLGTTWGNVASVCHPAPGAGWHQAAAQSQSLP